MDENKKKKKSIKSVKPNITDDYMDFLEGRYHPISEDFIRKMARDILEQSQNPETLRLAQITRKYPMPATQIYRWMESFPLLKDAWVMARRNLSDNREAKAQEDPRYFPLYARNQIVYDYEYRDALKWREDIKPVKNANDGNANITVVMNPSESHPNVPDVRVTAEPYELNDESGE